jgi:hypothetical protein
MEDIKEGGKTQKERKEGNKMPALEPAHLPNK